MGWWWGQVSDQDGPTCQHSPGRARAAQSSLPLSSLSLWIEEEEEWGVNGRWSCLRTINNPSQFSLPSSALLWPELLTANLAAKLIIPHNNYFMWISEVNIGILTDSFDKKTVDQTLNHIGITLIYKFFGCCIYTICVKTSLIWFKLKAQ